MKVRILKSIRLGGEHVPIGATAEVPNTLASELIHCGQAEEAPLEVAEITPEPEQPVTPSKKATK